MKGQWIGSYHGNVNGKIMINVDELDDHYEAIAYINPQDARIPSSVAYLHTKNKRKKQQTTAYLNAVDPRTGAQCKWEEIKDLYGDDVVHSSEASVKLNLKNKKLQIDSVSDLNISLISTLEKPSDLKESKIEGKEMSWNDFKNKIQEYSNSKYLFRGQKKPWRLRTSFHRKGRYHINKFINQDVRQLHQRLSAITNHFFDLTVPDQNGAFFNLLQHHGYPTPLLDWSYSPYVAAFFAFRDWPKNYNGKSNARIYIFNNQIWQKKYPQIQNIDPPHPNLSVMEFIAINNPRLVPQQAVTTVTNIDDIEAYILERESNSQESYLEAIDIPAKNRETVMRDLRFMGITAGSMFPSIDGICEQVREINFKN